MKTFLFPCLMNPSVPQTPGSHSSSHSNINPEATFFLGRKEVMVFLIDKG